MKNIIALVIPFDKKINVDWNNFNFLINFFFFNKIKNILILGTTGESHNYEFIDFINLILYVKKYKINFIFNISDINIKKIYNKIFLIKKNIFFFFLITIPKFILPNNISIYKYFKNISKFGVKIIFYNIPKRTSKKISINLLNKIIKKKFFFLIKNSLNNIKNNLIFKKKKIIIFSGEDKNLSFRNFYYSTISVFNNLLPKSFKYLNKIIFYFLKKIDFDINPNLIKFILFKVNLIIGRYNFIIFGLNNFFFTQSQT